jgi:hypothetical protein
VDMGIAWAMMGGSVLAGCVGASLANNYTATETNIRHDYGFSRRRTGMSWALADK